MVRSSAQPEAVSAATPRPAVRYAVAGPAPQPRAAVARSASSASVRPVAMSTAAADCVTTSDRVWRIAKRGSAAGKGALIGGLAGAALGTAYGAYQTKNECGSVFGGSGSGFTSAPSRSDDRVFTYAPAPAATPAAAGDRITVYDAGRSLPR
jgi:hypothetical protein